MKKYISIIIIILSTNLYAQCQEDLNGDGIANVVDIVALVNFVISDEVCEDANPYGCTDPNACNFNPDATIFDNTCTYDDSNDGYDCQGDMISCMPSDEIGICDPIGTITGNNNGLDESCWCEDTINVNVNETVGYTDGAFYTFDIEEVSGYNIDDYIITSVQNELYSGELNFNWETDGTLVTIEIIGFQSWTEFLDYCLLTGQYTVIMTGVFVTLNRLIIVEE